MTNSPLTKDAMIRIAQAVHGRRRFVLSSHARPDGDSIGSQLAMAYALRALGKEAVVVNADPAPAPLMQFPGVPDIRIAPTIDGAFDAAIIMECSDLARTGVTINALCPGWVETAMAHEAVARIVAKTGRSEAEARASLENMSPQRRMIQPEEVAHTCVMLCADEARGIHGQTIVIDGGAILK